MKTLRSSLSPPPYPASADTYGGLFSQTEYWRLATFDKKNACYAYITIWGRADPFQKKFTEFDVI